MKFSIIFFSFVQSITTKKSSSGKGHRKSTKKQIVSTQDNSCISYVWYDLVYFWNSILKYMKTKDFLKKNWKKRRRKKRRSHIFPPGKWLCCAEQLRIVGKSYRMQVRRIVQMDKGSVLAFRLSASYQFKCRRRTKKNKIYE